MQRYDLGGHVTESYMGHRRPGSYVASLSIILNCGHLPLLRFLHILFDRL